MGAFDRGRRHRPRHLRSTIWTLAVALGTAVTLLLVIAVVFLLATSPNWLGC